MQFCVMLQSNFFIKTLLLEEKLKYSTERTGLKQYAYPIVIQEQSQKLISLPIFTLRWNHGCQTGCGMSRLECYVRSGLLSILLFMCITKSYQKQLLNSRNKSYRDTLGRCTNNYHLFLPPLPLTFHRSVFLIRYLYHAPLLIVFELISQNESEQPEVNDWIKTKIFSHKQALGYQTNFTEFKRKIKIYLVLCSMKELVLKTIMVHLAFLLF